MFQALLNDAKSAAGSLVAKYVARASVAVPFLVAAGFAIAALTLTLVERFGAIAAYWMLAGGFTAVGLVAAAVVGVKEQDEAVAEARAEQADVSEVAGGAMAQAPLALLGTLLASPLGLNALAGSARAALRNLPLVAFLAALAFLLWPEEARVDADAENADPAMAVDSPIPDGLHREAA